MLPPLMTSVAIGPHLLRSCGCAPPYCSASSDVEVHDCASVLLDELAPRLDHVAHQHGEEAIGLRGVVDAHLLQRPGRRVHRGLTQLVGVHLPQALEARYLDA